MIFPRQAARRASQTVLPLRLRSGDSNALLRMLVARPVGEIFDLVTRQLSGHHIRVQRLNFGRFPENPLQNSFPGREKCGAALWAGLPWSDLPWNDRPTLQRLTLQRPTLYPPWRGNGVSRRGCHNTLQRLLRLDSASKGESNAIPQSAVGPLWREKTVRVW